MAIDAGVFTCAVGGMSLSQRLEATLVVRFGGRVRVDAPAPAEAARWFCPACRVPLDADLRCARCGGTLRDVLFDLVELHPHRSPV
jgi:hypothetical protein